MADRIKNYQQEADQITTLKAIRTDFGVTPSSYTPDATVVTKDRVVTFAQAEEELVVLSDIEKGVKQQIVDVDIAEKDIANIKALLQGNLYDYQTDSTSAYTKSVPSGAMPYAGLEQIGGKTVVFNQLVNTGTATVSTISGHKYYTLINGTASIVTSDGSAITIVDDTADMVCDLTLMFGSGNEPSTVAEFEAMFPADYYAYNAGTLLSAGVTEVVSHSINIWDEEWENGYYSRSTGNKDGNSNTTYFRCKNYIPVLPNTDYYFKMPSAHASNTSYFSVLYYDADKNYLDNSMDLATNHIKSMGANVRYITFYVEVGTSGSTYQHDICINVSNASINGTYHPHILATYPIPTAIRNLEGYGWSAGTAYNYVDFERKVFVKNVGKIILNGDNSQTINFVNWNNNGGWTYAYSVTNNKTSGTWLNIGNVISDAVPATSTYNISTNGAAIGIAVDGSTDNGICINIGNSSLTTAELIRTYLAANPITVYYELATPQEIDISEYITDDNLINVEAGGTLTFPNQNGTDYQIPVPSEETYMIDLQEAINNG